MLRPVPRSVAVSRHSDTPLIQSQVYLNISKSFVYSCCECTITMVASIKLAVCLVLLKGSHALTLRFPLKEHVISLPQVGSCCLGPHSDYSNDTGRKCENKNQYQITSIHSMAMAARLYR
jgi:hypothetical protein